MRKTTKALTDKEQLIKGYENRIKMHLKQLAAFRVDHKKIEAGMEQKIRREKITLSRLKKVK